MRDYKFLQPYSTAHHTFKNRVIMGSMHTGLEEKSLRKLGDFYEERARGGVALIITGGFPPNWAGKMGPFNKGLWPWQVFSHRKITERVHRYDCKICLQILHTGRYGFHPFIVAPSPLKSPITPFSPRKLSSKGIEKTIKDFVRTAKFAQSAGYDGVEIMGSEGYLINQFFSPLTNKRTDKWGGDLEGRKRLALEIVREIRRELGEKFLLIFRISLIDLVREGASWDEVVSLAKDLEKLGVDILNSGIGWHESRVPTIASLVPRGHFSDYTEKLKNEVSIPVVAVNRINSPEIAQEILENKKADFVSLARPFLADPHWVLKAKEGREEEINICIACNQACLDHIFDNKRASCLVNPMACYEGDFNLSPTENPLRIGVIGGGVAGMNAAYILAKRGHQVSLFEKGGELGGQFILASKIPGKEDFSRSLEFFKTMLRQYGVKVYLNKNIGESDRESFLEKFDAMIDATGVLPRIPSIEGVDQPKVISYPEAIKNPEKIGRKVAIIGAGGIGFDMAELLSSGPQVDFDREWGIDKKMEKRGAIKEPSTNPNSLREIYLLQRGGEKMGKNLSKTTGWIKRALLKKRGVHMWNSVQYLKISDQGLHIIHENNLKVLDTDHIILCSGQSSRGIFRGEKKVHPIGGALKAEGVDAKRAIREAFELACSL